MRTHHFVIDQHVIDALILLPSKMLLLVYPSKGAYPFPQPPFQILPTLLVCRTLIKLSDQENSFFASVPYRQCLSVLNVFPGCINNVSSI